MYQPTSQFPLKTKIFIVKAVSKSDQENLSKTTSYTEQNNDCTVKEFVYSATDIKSMLR
jgi:hypothetical protein